MSDDLLSLLQQLDDSDQKRTNDIVRAPFGYHGGKAKSINELLPRLPYRKGYCEVFGGSGVVLLNRRPSKLEVFNDRYVGVTSFYRCINNATLVRQLIDRLDLTIHSREEFEWCKDTWRDIQDDVERAARWYYMLQTSFGKQGRNWGRSVRSSGTIGQAFKNNLQLFWPAHDRFKNVQIENLDFRSCFKDYNDSEMVFYCDPPYLGAAPVYECGMTPTDHMDLLNLIFASKGYVALSGYDNDMYNDRSWDHKYTWEAFVASTPVTGGEFNNKPEGVFERGTATECLWIKESN